MLPGLAFSSGHVTPFVVGLDGGPGTSRPQKRRPERRP
jgi:hypothetical protein